MSHQPRHKVAAAMDTNSPHTSAWHNAPVFSIQDAFLLAGKSTGQMGCMAFSGQNKNGIECVEDPHQVGEKVTRILNISAAHFGESVRYISFSFSCWAELHVQAHKGHKEIKNISFMRQEKKMYMNNHKDSSVKSTVGFCDNWNLPVPEMKSLALKVLSYS